MPEKCIKDYVASAEASVAHQPPNQTKLTKMKSIILVALALVAVVAAAPAEQTEPIPIVQSNIEQQPDGSYRFGFETGDGITRQEVGEVKEVLDEENKPHTVVTVRGSYTYPGADGKPETVTYEADENGYRAVGNSIPKLATR